MDNRVRNIMGTVTIVAIVGGTAYAIYKHKQNKKMEEQAISVEEAISEVRGRDVTIVQRPNGTIKLVQPIDDVVDERIDTIMEDAREEADWNSSFYSNTEEDDEEEPEVEPIDLYNISEDGEEEKELRHDPNSAEALNQFINMELAEWDYNEESRKALVHLYTVPFDSNIDGDLDLIETLEEYRAEFFGSRSKWVNEITIADLIMHFSKTTQYNCDETVKFWAEYFLEFIEVDHNSSDHEMEKFVDALTAHTYFNEERQSYGLFGLTTNAMSQALAIANRNIDRSVTFTIEYNEFLKSCI